MTGDPEDQAAASTTFLLSLSERQVSATLLPTVVLEIVFVPERQYGSSRREISDALQEVLRFERLAVVNGAHMIDAADDYLARRGISFADAYHCAMARDFHNGSDVSSDRKLSSVPGVIRHNRDTI